jgi:hypothetical protein
LDAADVRGLLGLLLADGSLVRYRSPSGGYVQLTLTAGASESAFLEDKVAEFRQFLPTAAQIVPYKTTPRANGRSTLVLRFRVSTVKLRLIHNLLYPGGERRITSTALEMLGGRAAAWLWAEGARPGPDGSVALSRVGSSDSEAALVQHWLSTLTGADSQASESHLRPRLLFAPGEARKIRAALRDYAPASRLHLFREESWDVNTIRSARTELLLGQGLDSPQGCPQAALA